MTNENFISFMTAISEGHMLETVSLYITYAHFAADIQSNASNVKFILSNDALQVE